MIHNANIFFQKASFFVTKLKKLVIFPLRKSVAVKEKGAVNLLYKVTTGLRKFKQITEKKR